MDKFMQWQEHLTISQACAICLSIFICALVAFTLVDDYRKKRNAGTNRNVRLD